MNEFRIITPKQEPILIENKMPQAGNFRKLKGAVPFSAEGDFGQMLFQHFPGDGFSIWFSSYRMNKPVKFYGGTDDSILEFHCQYTNNFHAGWNGMANSPFRHRQYQVTFAPFIETTGEFPGARQYDTFDIHFYKDILQPYVDYCPGLGKLLEQVERGKPANLLNTVLFLTPGMEQAINEILNYSMFDELTASFFKRKVNDLLVHMIYHISSLDKTPVFDEMEIRKAQEVRRIILADFSVYDSVEILARKVGTTEQKLQLAFKHLYGVTVGKFSKDERMRKAYELLLFTNEILLAIALMVGYNDAGNFSTGFKNHFGYSPGHVQKRLKKQ